MNYTISPVKTPINAKIKLPGSKSITNRALLLAALANGTSNLSGVLFSDDTAAFLKALSELGVKISLSSDQKKCTIEGINGKFPQQKANIWCQDAGTAARFLLAACAVSEGAYSFNGSSTLCGRPLIDLMNILRLQGSEFLPHQSEKMPFDILSHGMIGGDIFVPGNQSSQFLSALLMISPFAKSSVALHTSDLISRPYVLMTCAMMKEFGVTVVQHDENKFTISTPQHYHSLNYQIEPDLSTASYFFSAAAISGGRISISDVNKATCKQGDIRFLDILELMGCHIESTNNIVVVQGNKKLKGCGVVDMGDISDTFMTLACLAPFTEKPTTIKNIGHTRFQESNRIEAVTKNLQELGVSVDQGADFITIYPGKPRAGIIDSYFDHRIAMAFSLIGLVVPGITIKNMDCVSKTCPNFIELWECISKNEQMTIV